MAPSNYINTGALSDEINNLPATADTNTQEAKYLDLKLETQVKLEVLKTKRQYNKTLKQNNIQRKKYARHIFIFTCIWAGVMLFIVIFSGFRILHLSDQVLITLITSTTINFFGFFLLVVKYLFNTNDKNIKMEGQASTHHH